MAVDRKKIETLGSEQSRIAEIGRIVNSTLNLSEVFSAFAEQVRELVPYDRLMITALSSDDSTLRTQFIDGVEFDDSPRGRVSPVGDDVVFKQVYEQNQNFVVRGADYREYKQGRPEEEARYDAGFRSALFVPVVWQGESVGGFGFRSRNPDAFNEHEIELAGQIANQIAGAIAAANQYARLERELFERERIAEIGRIVSSSINLDDVFAEFAEQARKLVPCDRMVIAVVSEDGADLVERFISGVGTENSTVGTKHPLNGDGISSDTNFLSAGKDYEDFSRKNSVETERYDAGFRSIFVTTMSWQGVGIGIITFRSFDPEAFGKREVGLGLQISRLLSGAIATTVQYGALERESEERERIADIGRIVSSTLDMNEVFAAFAEQARRLVPFDRLVIGTINEGRKTISYPLVTGIDWGTHDPLAAAPISKNALIREAILKGSYVVANGEEYVGRSVGDQKEEFRIKLGLKAVLIVPLKWQGEVTGIITFRSLAANAYGEHEIDLANQIGVHIAGAIATANQYAALERESQERERIAELGRIVSSTLDLNEVFTAFAKEVRELIPFDRIVISELSSDGFAIIERFIDGMECEDSELATRHLLGDRELSSDSYFLSSGKEYESFSQQTALEQQRFDAGFRSLLIYPLVWQGIAVGIITFRSLDPDAYGQNELRLAHQVSRQIAGAVAHSNQYSILQREARERERIAEIGRIVSSNVNMDDVFAAFYDEASELVPCDRMVISSLSPDGSELVDRHIGGLEVAGIVPGTGIPTGRPGVFKGIVEKDPYFIAQGADYEELIKRDQNEELRFDVGFRSVLAVRLEWQGALYGIITFRSLGPEAFGNHEIELALLISNQIAGAIATANQYELLERDSFERERIGEIGRIVSSNLALDEVFSSFNEQVRELVPFDRIVISVTSEDGSELIDRFVEGLLSDDFAEGARYSVYATDAYQSITTQNVHFVSNGEEYANYEIGSPAEDARRAAGLKSLLLVPLIWQGSVIGTISFRSKNPDAYDDNKIGRAWLIANQIAGAIHSSNQYALLERESHQRERIAEIGRIVSSSQNLDEVFAAFFDEVRELIPFDRLAVGLIDAHRNLIYGVHVGGLKFGQPDFDQPLDLDQSALPALVYEEHQTVVANRKELERVAATDKTHGSRLGLAAGLRSVMFVPVVQQGITVAALVFRSKLPDPYTEHEINLAKQIASQIAGVIASGQQYTLVEQESSERQRLAEEQSRIAEIGRIVSSTLELDDVYPAIAEHARTLVPSDRLVISLYSADRLYLIEQFIGGVEVEGSVVGRRIPVVCDDLFQTIVNHKQHFLINDEENTDLRSVTAEEVSRVSLGFKAMLIVPLLWQGSVYGTVTFRAFESGAFGSREIDLANQIGAQVAGAIATSNQFKQLEKETLERQVLASISTRASQSTGLSELFEGLADDIAEIIPYSRLSITRNDFESSELVVIFNRGETSNKWQVGVPYPGEIDPLDTENLDERKSQIWRDSFRLETVEHDSPKWSHVERLGNADPGTEEYDFSSWIDVPIGVPNEIPSAFISVRISGRDKYSQHEQDLLSQIAIQIAPAVDNAHAYDLLETSEENYRDLVERGHLFVARLNSEGQFTYTNPGWHQGLGYTFEEMIGKTFAEFQPDRIIEESWAYWNRVKAGESIEFETVFTTKPGFELIASINASPVLDGEGTFVGVRAMGLDVTAERAAQADLRTQAAALEAASDAIVILRPDTRMEYVNEAFVRQTGYSQEEAIAAKSPFMRSSKDSDAVYDRLWEGARRGEVGRATITTRRKDGTEFPTDIFMSPVFDDEGTITRFVAIRRDMSEQIEAEKERAVRHDLDMQNVELQRITEQRDDFFSSVSHELRTPLTSVMAFADILSRNRTHNLSTTQLDHLQVIKRNSHSLNDLVEDMLDISRLNSNKLKIEPRPIELDELIKSVVKSLSPTVRERKQVLKIESDTKGIWLDADPGRIIQIISNLVTNSCKYSPNRTTITVTTSCKKNVAEIQVIDEGYGMTPEELDLLFSPFSRSARTEIRRESGTGLGMSISKTLVELHGGKIWAESELDVGTSVTVSLPVVIDRPQEPSDITQ